MSKIENGLSTHPKVLDNSIHYADTQSVRKASVEPILGDINQQLRNMSVTIRGRLIPHFSRHYSNTILLCEYRRRKPKFSHDSLSKRHSRALINSATGCIIPRETTRRSASLSAKTFDSASRAGQRVDSSDICIVKPNALVVTKSQFGGLICKMSGNNDSKQHSVHNNNKNNNHNNINTNNKIKKNYANANDDANDCISGEILEIKYYVNTNPGACVINTGGSLNITRDESPTVASDDESIKTYDNYGTTVMSYNDPATKEKASSILTTTTMANTNNNNGDDLTTSNSYPHTTNTNNNNGDDLTTSNTYPHTANTNNNNNDDVITSNTYPHTGNINNNNDDDVTTSNTYPHTASNNASPTSHLVSHTSDYQASLQDPHDSGSQTSLLESDNRAFQTSHLDSSNNKSSSAFTITSRLRRDSSNNAATERLEWQMQSVTDVLNRRTRMRTLVDSLLAWAVIQFVTLLVLFVLSTSCRCVFQIAFPCNGGDKCRLRKQ